MGERVAKAALVLAFVVAGQAFLFPKYAELLHVPLPRFLDLALYLPAVVLGLRAWIRTRCFARSWPLVLCVALVWIGLVYARRTESQRGLLIAYLLTMVLPAAALVDACRAWWLCARTFVLSSVAAFALTAWFEYQAYNGKLITSLVRFGWLLSVDGVTRLANPNPVGGQFALAAVLALVLYLKSQSAQRRMSALIPHGGMYLGWTVVLTCGCLLTASRSAFFSWLAGVALLVFLGTRHLPMSKLRDLVAYMGMLVAAALFLAVGGSHMPWAHLYQRTLGSRNDTIGSLGSRLYIWENAWRALRSEPKYFYFGTGVGVADEVLGAFDAMARADDYGVLRRNAHSAYVEWLLSGGLLGLVAASLLAATMIFRAWQLDRREGVVSRRAVLLFVAMFAATIVIHRISWWFAAAVLTLSMLTDGRPPGRRRMGAQEKGQAEGGGRIAGRVDPPHRLGGGKHRPTGPGGEDVRAESAADVAEEGRR